MNDQKHQQYEKCLRLIKSGDIIEFHSGNMATVLGTIVEKYNILIWLTDSTWYYEDATPYAFYYGEMIPPYPHLISPYQISSIIKQSAFKS